MRTRFSRVTAALVGVATVSAALPALAGNFDNGGASQEVSLYGKQTVAGDTAIAVDASGFVKVNIAASAGSITVVGPAAAGAAVSGNPVLAGGRDSLGNAQYLSFSGSGNTAALKVDASATTQPVSGTITANQGGAPWTVKGEATGSVNAYNALMMGSRDAAGNAQLLSSTGAGITNNLQVGIFNGSTQAAVTAGNALKVDGSAVTQPVSIAGAQSVNVSQIGGNPVLTGNGITGIGSQRVTIASDQTAFAVNATLQAAPATIVGQVKLVDTGGTNVASIDANNGLKTINEADSSNQTLLAQTTIAAAQAIITGSTLTGLTNMKSAVFQAIFNYGSGGTSVDAYVQTSLDAGLTWVDIAEFNFATAAATKWASTNMYTAAPAFTITTDTLAANSVVTGVLGDRLRLRWKSAGTYAGATNLQVLCHTKG